jgi:hypothetical protein
MFQKWTPPITVFCVSELISPLQLEVRERDRERERERESGRRVK